MNRNQAINHVLELEFQVQQEYGIGSGAPAMRKTWDALNALGVTDEEIRAAEESGDIP